MRDGADQACHAPASSAETGCVVAHVPEVQTVEELRFQDAGGARPFVHGMGSVDAAGWSRLGLRPQFYALPLADWMRPW